MAELSDNEIKNIQDKLFELLVAFKDICDKENIWYSLAFGSVLGAVRHKGFIPWDTDADVFIKLEDKEKFREAFYKHKPEGIKLNDISKEKKCLQSHDKLLLEKNDIDFDIHLDIYQLVGAPNEENVQTKYIKYAHNIDKIIRSKYVNIHYCKNKNKWKVAIVKFLLFFVPDSVLRKNIHKRETKYDVNKAEYLMVLCGYGKQKECLPKNLILESKLAEFNGVEFNIPRDSDKYLKRIYGDDYMTPIQYD
ncbi:MAG: LicD family protein [Lachnospiraceae bacterium]|nr:LicD family protein [Lachnospiraceae bacterium]